MALPDGSLTHFEVKVKGTMAAGGVRAKTTTNVLFYRRTNFPVVYSATAFLTAFHALIKADWKAMVSASWTWDSTEVRCINDPTMLAATATVGEVGGIAGDFLPSQIAMRFEKVTGFRGGSYRGRMFMAGVGESATTGNALTNGHKALADTVATLLMSNVTDAGGIIFTPFNLAASLSKLSIAVPRVVGADIAAVTAIQKLSEQKRRRAI